MAGLKLSPTPPQLNSYPYFLNHLLCLSHCFCLSPFISSFIPHVTILYYK